MDLYDNFDYNSESNFIIDSSVFEKYTFYEYNKDEEPTHETFINDYDRWYNYLKEKINDSRFIEFEIHELPLYYNKSQYNINNEDEIQKMKYQVDGKLRFIVFEFEKKDNTKQYLSIEHCNGELLGQLSDKKKDILYSNKGITCYNVNKLVIEDIDLLLPYYDTHDNIAEIIFKDKFKLYLFIYNCSIEAERNDFMTNKFTNRGDYFDSNNYFPYYEYENDDCIDYND